MSTCDCTYDYGVCDKHGTVLAQREGASARTTDELCALFLADAATLVDAERIAQATALAGTYSDVTGWCEDADTAESLYDAVYMVESWLRIGIVTFWDDGYRIVQVSDDCPIY